jgi:hypothetical protein
MDLISQYKKYVKNKSRSAQKNWPAGLQLISLVAKKRLRRPEKIRMDFTKNLLTRGSVRRDREAIEAL